MKQGSWRGTFSAVLFATLLAGLASSVTAIADTTDTTTSSPTDNGDSLATGQTTESLLGGGGTDSGAIAYGEGVLGPQKHETGVTALGPDLFGEEVNTYTGGISFSQTDLSLPGNNSLPVSVTRRLIVDGSKSPTFPADVNLWRGYSFGEWELDLPYIGGTYSDQNGWDVSTSTPNARCSSPNNHDAFQPHDVEAAEFTFFYNFQFWNGLQLNVPGQGEQGLLYRPAGAPFPSPSSALLPANAVGGWTALTTKDQWHFACLPSLQSGQAGEGFMALAPDGTRYWFDWMVSFADRTMHGTGSWTDSAGVTRRTSADLNRRNYRIYPTRVEDRFGNYVTYTYASIPSGGLKITNINASDGRSIGFGYNAGGQIASATAGTQTVNYGYAGGLLSTVTLPDGSGWGYSSGAMVDLPRFVLLTDPNHFDEPYTCQLMRTLSGDTADLTMTSPSGAQGTFHLGYNRLYRTDISGATGTCNDAMMQDGIPRTWRDRQPTRPLRYDVLALQQKTLSGPGMATQTWQYQHQDDFQAGTSGNGPIDGIRTMTTVRPDGSKEVSVFGTDALVNEGQLLSRKVLAADGTVLTQQTNTYVQTSEMASMPFPDWMGEPLHYEFIRGREDYNRPLKQSVLQQQGESFTSAVNTFDPQVRPTKVTRSSTVGSNYSRTEQTTYAPDNTTKWVLGLVTKTTCAAAVPALTTCDGGTDSVESETTYDPTYAVPLTTKAFGKLQKTMGYTFTTGTQDGTLHTVKDGNNHVTTLSNWYRGIPQTITYADTNDISASVNANGWITSVVDENGYATGYGYDTMGRLSAITYPTGDSTAWNNTTIVYAKTTASEYGIPAGHWKRTESTGNGRKVTYLDAMWRPLVEEQYDNANAAATRSLSVKRYDNMGRLAFQAYPVATLPNGYADAALKGTDTYYDALGRVTSVQQDWEGTGKLTTTTTYLSGFRTKVTNPRTFSTVTSYMAYDQPTTEWPVTIQAAYGRTPEEDTDIVRDPYGKPLSITRHDPGNTVTETRNYIYDQHQLLCKTIEPETGSTLVDYDGANNVIWSASGQALPGLGCDRASVAVADQTARSYDARNRLLTLRFPSGQGDQDWSYTPDGLPEQITTYNAVNQGNPVIDAYHYNKRRMPDGSGESLQQPGWYTWAIGYGYDANGHLSVQTYPGNVQVTFAPNALGQPTQAGTYATGVSYYPNGAIKQFTYGNGIVHTMTQNARQLPDTSTDAYGSTKFISDGYDYDPNGNVLAITDGATGSSQHGNRDMTYDSLDRLLSATSPMFGNGAAGTTSFEYDALDNLTKLAMPATPNTPARTQYYCYDATSWRLSSLRSAANCGGTIQTSLTYDTQGNLASKGAQAYVFGKDNRLYATVGKESYRYDANGRRVLQYATNGSGNILSKYTRDGQLLVTADYRRDVTNRYIYLGGSLVAIRETPFGGSTSTIKYQHTDALGTPVAVTNESRAVVERSEYEPYGQLLNRAQHDGPGFTGHVQDALTGLTYMQQRYYDPMIGAFLSVDPVTALSNPVGSFNRYDYAADNPYRFKDPDGRAPCIGSLCRQYKGAWCQMTCVAIPSNSSVGPNGCPACETANRSQSRPSSTHSAGAQNNNSTTRLNKYGLEPGDATNIAGGTLTAEDMAAQFLKKLPKSMGITDLPDGQAMLKAGGRLGAAVSGINIALSANEAFNGESSADRWHGRINLALAAAPAVVGPEVIVVTRPYGWVDSAVQFHEYVDPSTGEKSTGWSALYNQFVR